MHDARMHDARTVTIHGQFELVVHIVEPHIAKLLRPAVHVRGDDVLRIEVVQLTRRQLRVEVGGEGRRERLGVRG